MRRKEHNVGLILFRQT